MKKLHLIALAVLIGLCCAPLAYAARTDNSWNDNGLYLSPINNLNLLLSGTNRYLNFGTFSGSSGYGFRDNAGTIEFKNSGGSWAGIGDIPSSKQSWEVLNGALSPTTTLPIAISSTATSTFAGDLIVQGDTLINFGPSPLRQLTSTTSVTLFVGPTRQYKTVQSAVNQIPYFLLNPYVISIDPGVYDEDVIVFPTITTRFSISDDFSEDVPLRIVGSTTDPSLVTLHSITFTNNEGDHIALQGVSISGSSPYDNEDSGVSIYGSTDVGLFNVDFTGGVNGVVCYFSGCSIDGNVDFGTNILTGLGIKAKRFGHVLFDPASVTPSAGRVGTYAYEAQAGGSIDFDSNVSTLGGAAGLVSHVASKTGTVLDGGTKTYYTISNIVEHGDEALGIGTTSPSDQSQVEISNFTNITQGTTSLRLSEVTGTPSYWDFASVNSSPASGLIISGGAQGAQHTALTLDGSGNVQIGVLGTSQKLSIPGNNIFFDIKQSQSNAFTKSDTTGLEITDVSGASRNIYVYNSTLSAATLGLMVQGKSAIGTTTPNGMFQVVAGSTGTTTLSEGDQYSTNSKVCHNSKSDSGQNVSWYIHGTAMVVESGLCK